MLTFQVTVQVLCLYESIKMELIVKLFLYTETKNFSIFI